MESSVLDHRGPSRGGSKHHHTTRRRSRTNGTRCSRRSSGRGPTLADAPYSVGAVAVEMLRREIGIDSILEYWRLLTSPGANGSVDSDWRRAFHLAFEEDYQSFLERFARYHVGLGGDIGTLTLTLEDVTGAPLTDWTVQISSDSIRENRFYRTDERGLVQTALFRTSPIGSGSGRKIQL